jgi:hypothetical protein
MVAMEAGSGPGSVAAEEIGDCVSLHVVPGRDLSRREPFLEVQPF